MAHICMDTAWGQVTGIGNLFDNLKFRVTKLKCVDFNSVELARFKT